MLNESVKNMRNRTVRLDREGDYWTDQEKEQLVRMFRDGEGITTMAICLQRTEPAVMQQIEKMDLYQRKTNPSKRKLTAKPPTCLCAACQLDSTFCPRCEAHNTTQEDE